MDHEVGARLRLQCLNEVQLPKELQLGYRPGC